MTWHKNVHYLTTPRYLDSGVSVGSYANFNLAAHTGDNKQSVMKNRQLLQHHYQLPSMPKWLNQAHSDCCLQADKISSLVVADASWTKQKGVVCAILTADCLPIFISNTAGDCIAIVHAGYQGLLAGIIEKTIRSIPIQANDMLVHLGPCIGSKALSLDKKIFKQFSAKNPNFTDCFQVKEDNYYLDIQQIAEIIFNQHNIININSNNACTYDNDSQYFSYRRDGPYSGRMANLIWMS